MNLKDLIWIVDFRQSLGIRVDDTTSYDQKVSRTMVQSFKTELHGVPKGDIENLAGDKIEGITIIFRTTKKRPEEKEELDVEDSEKSQPVEEIVEGIYLRKVLKEDVLKEVNQNRVLNGQPNVRGTIEDTINFLEPVKIVEDDKIFNKIIELMEKVVKNAVKEAGIWTNLGVSKVKTSDPDISYKVVPKGVNETWVHWQEHVPELDEMEGEHMENEANLEDR